MSGYLPLTVKNASFIVDRIGKDCPRLQFIREYTMNSMQAITDAGGKGDILWDIDRELLRVSKGKHRKLCVIDTGVGMDEAELLEYINKLASSGHVQAIDENFGMGGKVSALPYNHHGILYSTWKEGQPGKSILLWRHPTAGYAARQMEMPPESGNFAYVFDVPEENKPDLIREAGHGTKVTFLGMSELEDTTLAPEEAAYKSRWVIKYLNTRFSSFPKGITVRASFANAESKLEVNGQHYFLEKIKKQSGKFRISGSTIHWWILGSTNSKDGHGSYGHYNSTGHVAALYKNELYEMDKNFRAAQNRLQQCGIYFGFQKVVLYIEPDVVQNGKVAITSNTARDKLQMGKEALPWEEYYREVYENMPAPIKKLIDEESKLAIVGSSDTTEMVRKHLHLFSFPSYRPVESANDEADENSASEVGINGHTVKNPPPYCTYPPRKPNGPGTTITKLFTQEGNDLDVKKVVAAPRIPERVWVTVENGSRVAGDLLEDRAAEYLPQQNIIKINADFRAFTDMILRLIKLIPGVENSAALATEAMRREYERLLLEAVIGIVQLTRSTKYWSPDDVKKSCSPEALTAIVMQRIEVFNSSMRYLGTKTGIRVSERAKKREEDNRGNEK